MAFREERAASPRAAITSQDTDSSMITAFRRFFSSKIGIVVTLAFLALIAVAFAAMDVGNNATFGGVAGGDRVAVVGDRTISTSDLSQNVNNALNQARQQNPTLSMAGFIAQGGFDEVLEQLLSRAAISGFAESLGLRAGDRLVNSEITASGRFNGIDGNFDPAVFQQFLQQQGLTESTVREDLAQSLLARQLVLPISFQAQMPQSFARTYAQLLGETRIGNAAAFPAEAFAPSGNPTDEQLQSYYNQNRQRYIRPERRTIRYAVFGAEDLNNVAAVTDAQIAARYQSDRAQYSAREQRSFTQLVAATEAAAQVIADEVRAGMSMEASAQPKGLATTTVEDVERAGYASSTSQAVAAAAFGASSGAVVGPIQGSLGWYVIRVDDVTTIPARSLDQVSDEIRETMEAERRREALNEVTENLEDEFARGRSLREVAEELGVEIQTSRPLLANGQVYGEQEQAPQDLARVLSYAFELGEEEAQLGETPSGEDYVVYDVGRITRSATAPLAEIRDSVVSQWRRDRGMAAAQAAARRVVQRVENGASLAEAVQQEEVTLPAIAPLRINRAALAEQGALNRGTILFFSMAEGTIKPVAIDESNRWLVVQLDEIETPDLADNDPSIARTATELSVTMGEEYVQQFVSAAENAMEIERNEDGVNAVRAELSGQNR